MSRRAPNPEVPASMDRAARLAQQINADLVLSTDPDADRLGAMIQGSGARGQEIRGQRSGVRGQGGSAGSGLPGP